MAGETDGRPISRPAEVRTLLEIDLDGRLTVPLWELREGETVRDLAQRYMTALPFKVHMIRGTSRRIGR